MKWVLLTLIWIWSCHADAQSAPVALPQAWQDAMEKTQAGQTTDAIAALVALDQRIRDGEDGDMAQLTRYYILHNLALAGRYQELISRIGIVRADALPIPFRQELQRLEAEAQLETGNAQRARSLLDSLSSRTGRMELLRGRALAELGESEAARNAIADGLVIADEASPREKQEAVRVLIALLEASGRLGEAERIEGLTERMYGKPLK